MDDADDIGAAWAFSADNFTAQEAGYIPGKALVYVDKLDAHVWEEDEIAAMWSLSTLEPSSSV